MPKGFLSQGVVILFESAPSLDAIASVLSPQEVARRKDAGGDWAFGGPTLLVPFRPEANGYVAIDVAPAQWPDSMGDPHDGTAIFGAWVLGHFGPYTFPGNLMRAGQQAWHWSQARAVASRHAAFVRVRASYVFGGNKDAPVLPAKYDPLAELVFVTEMARRVMKAPGGLCYFNPGGECLYPPDQVDHVMERHRTSGPAAQELWANVRMFALPQDPTWRLMDTVGMGQLDGPDHEACFPLDLYEASEVAMFLRNAADYVFKNGQVIRDGDTMDGPAGIRWQGATFEKGIADPPREVIRWLPYDGRERPNGIEGQAPTGGA